MIDLILCFRGDALIELGSHYANQTFYVFYAPANFVCGEVYCFHVVHPSVRLSIRPSVFPSVRPSVCPSVTLFFLISLKCSDGYSSVSADTLISISCTYI